jgi:metal-responsive CopG/Arc/MetJ family transcriptional regulator
MIKMAARLEEETTKIHFHIYTKDLEEIDALLCRQGLRTIGRSKVLRSIIHSYLQQIKRKAHAKSVTFDPTIADIIDN